MIGGILLRTPQKVLPLPLATHTSKRESQHPHILSSDVHDLIAECNEDTRTGNETVWQAEERGRLGVTTFFSGNYSQSDEVVNLLDA